MKTKSFENTTTIIVLYSAEVDTKANLILAVCLSVMVCGTLLLVPGFSAIYSFVKHLSIYLLWSVSRILAWHGRSSIPGGQHIFFSRGFTRGWRELWTSVFIESPKINVHLQPFFRPAPQLYSISLSWPYSYPHWTPPSMYCLLELSQNLDL
jgi:hypothetical protein